ncbi:MAG: type I restriction enzyme HsdR N-terminal domain-containing protein, partial [Gemmatimonadota bacterium]|nr:type I restriction enzyme HsdR N-terminal domain-containing protein [Gemmatimonadota bacterium]
MASQKLDTLINEIKKLDLDELSETRIKQGVISRILNGLGWDTFNISEVIMEHSVGTMRVDYALHISNDKKVFIEAKSGSEKLENHQEQLLNYSFKEGVRLSILTNGETWWFYLPLESGNWEHRRFYSINIKGQSTEVISRKFIDFLAKEKVEDGTAIENAETALKSRKRKDTVSKTLPTAWERIITEPDELLVELLLDKTEEICGYRPDSKEVQDFLKTISFEEKKKPHQPEKIKIKKPYKPKKDDVKLHEFSGSKEFILEDLA